MEIKYIFARKLYSLIYNGENELIRLMNDWDDPEYILKFIKDNSKDIPKGKTIEVIMEEIENHAIKIEEILFNKKSNLDQFFQPLDNNKPNESIKILQQKGKSSYLRVYAIKLDTNCYLITGGAIKFTLNMNDAEHTREELRKIERCSNFLIANNVIDSSSFFEFLDEL